MRVVAVIASYGRKNILDDAVNCIVNQVADIVIVGSSGTVEGSMLGCSYEKEFAESHNLIYVDHKNSPLGKKWQTGLNRARGLQPDAVLICGSDDLLPSGWVIDFMNQTYAMTEKRVLYGAHQWYVYNTMTQEMVMCQYLNRIDPIGAGRIISAKLLDSLDWQIFPDDGSVGCDLYSYRQLTKHAHEHELIENNRALCPLCVKGTWNCLDSWQQIIAAPSLNVLWVSEEEKSRVLNTVFDKTDFGRYQ